MNSEADAALVSTAGDAALFRSFGAFAGYETGGEGLDAHNFYFSRRTGTGADAAWSTVPGMPRPTQPQAARNVFLVTADLRDSVLQTYTHAFEPDPPPASGSNLYLRDNLTRTTSLLFNMPEATESTALAFAATDDLGHIGMTSRTVFDDDAVAVPTTWKVYDYADGDHELVSRQPDDDEPFATDAALAGYGSGGAYPLAGGAVDTHSVSTDGSKIFFETPANLDGPLDDTAAIYRRADGATELASPSQRTPVDPLGPRKKVFRRATPDGNRVFFTSPELLTDNANTGPSRNGSDLYRYDMNTHELRNISATPDGDGAMVDGVVGVSDSGNRVYYVGFGAVVPGGVAGQANLYFWQDDGTPSGSTRFIGTLDPADNYSWAGNQTKQSRVTPDGRYMVLRSQASMTGYPNNGTTQIFRYDADAPVGQRLLCVSCNPSGNEPTGPSTVSGSLRFARMITDDGRYTFFNSVDSLVPRDTNGKKDVYVWSEGKLDLLSTGRSTSASVYAGTSADGKQVFFSTRERLVPQDLDSNVDIYVASVGGGLTSQQATVSPDCGLSCQPPPAGGPRADDPDSSQFRGNGNVVTRKSCASLSRKTARARKSARRLGRLARRASGQRARQLTAKHRVAKKRYAKALRKTRNCKRGAK